MGNHGDPSGAQRANLMDDGIGPTLSSRDPQTSFSRTAVPASGLGTTTKEQTALFTGSSASHASGREQGPTHARRASESEVASAVRARRASPRPMSDRDTARRPRQVYGSAVVRPGTSFKVSGASREEHSLRQRGVRSWWPPLGFVDRKNARTDQIVKVPAGYKAMLSRRGHGDDEAGRLEGRCSGAAVETRATMA